MKKLSVIKIITININQINFNFYNLDINSTSVILLCTNLINSSINKRNIVINSEANPQKPALPAQLHVLSVSCFDVYEKTIF